MAARRLLDTWSMVGRLAVVLVGLATVSACGVIPRPTVTGPNQSWGETTTAERASIYRAHRLRKRCGLSQDLIRADGTYSYVELRDVVGRYPRSRGAYERAARRDDTLLVGLAVGLTLVGAAAMDHAAEGLEGAGRLGDGGRIALYATGGAILAATLAGALWWRDPVADIPALYNAELRADLELDPDDEGDRCR